MRGSPGKVVFLFSVCLTLGGPAFAQLSTGSSGFSSGPPWGAKEVVPTGTRISRSIPDLTASEAESIKVLHRFSSCIADKKRADSLGLLSTRVNSPEQNAVVKRLIGKSSSCLKGAARMSLSAVLFRGGIAEALYKTDFPANPSTPAAAPVAPARGDSNLVLRSFSDCVVRGQPAAVDRLLRTEPGSTMERTAINDLDASFAPCALEGQTLEMNLLTLRAALAEAQYAWARGIPAVAVTASSDVEAGE